MLDLELDFELEAQVLHGEALLRVDVLQRSIVGRGRVVTGDAERGVSRGRGRDKRGMGRRSLGLARGDAGGADLRAQRAHRFLELVVASDLQSSGRDHRGAARESFCTPCMHSRSLNRN
jgi:hypothetical protein